MKYLVELQASMERGNAVDAQGGPAPLFAHIAEQFKPEAFYGNPTRRQVFLIVDLATEAAIAELMIILTWATGNEPTFTPIMSPETVCGAGHRECDEGAIYWATLGMIQQYSAISNQQRDIRLSLQ
jgi:hypothetical protein